MAENNSAVEYFLALADEAERVITSDVFAEKLEMKEYSVEDRAEEKLPPKPEKPAEMAPPRRAPVSSERFSLRDSYLNCHSCPLWFNRDGITHPAVGSMHPLVLFVFPRMLSGGAFLPPDEMAYFKKWLASICLEPKEAGLTSIIKCPGGGDEVPGDCLGLLKSQCGISRPRCIVFFGSSANMAGVISGSLEMERGRDFSYEGIPAVATYAPGEVLADLSLKRDIWKDLQHIADLAGIAERRKQGV